MIMQCFKLLSIGLLLALESLISAEKCESGVDNVLALEDQTKDLGRVQFHDVKVVTLDANLRPFCSNGAAALHFPGFLQLITGTIEIRKPLDEDQAQIITLELSAKQNSFFVGEVCKKGKSQNAFISDDICSWDFCALLGPESCRFFKRSGRTPITTIYPHPIPLNAISNTMVEGEWFLSATLRHRGEELAGIALPPKWHAVVLGQKHDEVAFQRNVERITVQRNDQKLAKIDDEL